MAWLASSARLAAAQAAQKTSAWATPSVLMLAAAQAAQKNMSYLLQVALELAAAQAAQKVIRQRYAVVV